jgi:hypothetical protein
MLKLNGTSCNFILLVSENRELPFTCLPVSRLFWVSSLAYPNLLGTKGYVVVVVVVVVVSENREHVVQCFIIIFFV